MRTRPTLLPFASLAALALASAPAAQGFVTGTVGPNPAPIGCDVQITFSNDSPFFGSTMADAFEVFDANMQPVFTPAGFPISIDMGPWGWFTAKWDQRDDSGQQVPPGTYIVRTDFDAGPSTFHTIQIGGTEAGLVTRGSPSIFETLGGQSREFFLCSPQDGGRPYLLLASFTADVGIPTCGGTFPLDPDPLLTLSLEPNAVFQGSLGMLQPDGTTDPTGKENTAPFFDLPEDPILVGQSLVAAFVVLDFRQPCIVRRISSTHPMTIIG